MLQAALSYAVSRAYYGSRRDRRRAVLSASRPSASTTTSPGLTFKEVDRRLEAS
jgi:hypothetical protein